MPKRFESLLQEGKPIGLANIEPALDGIVLTEQDLKDMVLTAGHKNIKPYIAKGHDGVYDGGREPSYGYFDPSSISYRNGVLYATPEYVNSELIDEIENGKYQKLSIEFSWVNFKDTPVYNEQGQELTTLQALISWLAFDNSLYDQKGNEINPRDIFKYYLNGVAVLGRATPAYPQFDLSKKRIAETINENDFNNCFVVRTAKQIYIDRKKENKEVSNLMEDTKSVTVSESPDNENIQYTKSQQSEDIKEAEEKEEKKEKAVTEEMLNDELKDAYDNKLDVMKREIQELKQELELAKTQKQNAMEEKNSLMTELKNTKHDLNRYRVYNLWLTYRNDGRLRREDMIDPDYNIEKAMLNVRSIKDGTEREIAKRKANMDAVCSGKFFQDFNNATEEVREMMIRNIERKSPLVEKEQKSYGKKQSEPQPDYIQENTYSVRLYKKSRELAKARGIDITSPDFDVEVWRREAIRKLEEEENGGFYA